MLVAAANATTAPDGTSLASYWRAQDPKQAVRDIGGGSDHEPFAFHENIPAAQGAFYGPFGTYHSAYDDIASLKILDPGMHRAAAAARYTSLVVMRLGGALVPDERLADVATAMQARVDALGASAAGASASSAQTQRLQHVTSVLHASIAAFAVRAATVDAAIDTAVASGDPAASARAYGALRSAEDAFYVPTGIDGGWPRSLLFGEQLLPTLETTLDESHGDAALAQLTQAIDASTK